VPATASITIFRAPEEVRRRWDELRCLEDGTASVVFREAPSDRGTEVHVDLGDVAPHGAVGAIRKATGTDPLAITRDALRRFKQIVETGEVARSDASPEGERVQGKLSQRPAQPLSRAEHEKAGV
jgi:uncharacterized membrane protein